MQPLLRRRFVYLCRRKHRAAGCGLVDYYRFIGTETSLDWVLDGTLPIHPNHPATTQPCYRPWVVEEKCCFQQPDAAGWSVQSGEKERQQMAFVPCSRVLVFQSITPLEFCLVGPFGQEFFPSGRECYLRVIRRSMLPYSRENCSSNGQQSQNSQGSYES